MRSLWVSFLSALICFAAADPDETIEFTPSVVYNKNYVIYTGEHDIANIVTPLNKINFGENSSESESSSEESDSSNEESDVDYTIFFVEADDIDGKKDYKGLYIYKDGEATKLLESGTDIAVTQGSDSLAYLAAKDGIFVYNGKSNKVKKYGTIDDSIIGIAKENRTDDLYILSEDHAVYKVTDGGIKKTEIPKAKGAQQIVLDWDDNLFYYGADKKPYVIAFDGIKEVTGLPTNPSVVKLIKPPITVDFGAGFLSDNNIYMVFSNGTSEVTEFKVEEKPTAASLEGALVHFYGHNKKIYKFNIFTALHDHLSSDVKEYVDSGKIGINDIKERLKNEN